MVLAEVAIEPRRGQHLGNILHGTALCVKEGVGDILNGILALERMKTLGLDGHLSARRYLQAFRRVGSAHDRNDDITAGFDVIGIFTSGNIGRGQGSGGGKDLQG